MAARILANIKFAGHSLNLSELPKGHWKLENLQRDPTWVLGSCSSQTNPRKSSNPWIHGLFAQQHKIFPDKTPTERSMKALPGWQQSMERGKGRGRTPGTNRMRQHSKYPTFLGDSMMENREEEKD